MHDDQASHDVILTIHDIDEKQPAHLAAVREALIEHHLVDGRTGPSASHLMFNIAYSNYQADGSTAETLANTLAEKAPSLVFTLIETAEEDSDDEHGRLFLHAGDYGLWSHSTAAYDEPHFTYEQVAKAQADGQVDLLIGTRWREAIASCDRAMPSFGSPDRTPAGETLAWPVEQDATEDARASELRDGDTWREYGDSDDEWRTVARIVERGDTLQVCCTDGSEPGLDRDTVVERVVPA